MLLVGSISSAVALSQETAPLASPTKDHVLFVGTDLSVKRNDQFYRVVGATKKTLRIEKEHKVEEVRLSGDANIKINKGVKLSNLSATIGHIQTESIDRESARAQLASMRASMALMDEVSDHEDRLNGPMTILSAVAIRPHPEFARRGTESFENFKQIEADATAAYVAALPALDQLRTATSTVLSQNIMHTDATDDEVTLDASALPGLNLLGGSAVGESGSSGSASALSQNSVPGGAAAVELTFDVSSPEPLENAYIVVVANYAALGKSNEVARQISAREFAHIDSRPQRVKMSHAASMNHLPFKKFDIGLFANGQEVATNLSEKRMALTRDQAFQFFLIDYLSTHKGATLPPTPMLMTPRAEFRRQVEKAESNQTIYAAVDKMGRVLTLSADATGTQRLPAATESALQNVRFMPALKNGVPVRGQAKVMLAQLAN
jgi:hypothetical protein